MGGSFFGLNIAISGLFTSQKSMDVVNHNIANVNTPGYSRQQVVQTAARPMPTYDGTGMMGTGSQVTGVSQVRDQYLDFKYWSVNDTSGQWSAKDTQMSNLEAIFNEPSDSGFSTIMDDFYNSLEELAKDPSSSANRAIVREKGDTLAKYFNNMAANLQSEQADINDSIQSDVNEINSLGVKIQQLNKQIYTAELDGSTANDLRDQRTLLVDQLSKLVNIKANEVVVGKLPNGKDDKHFVITISGKAFVDHFNLSTLSLTPRTTKQNADDAPNLYDVGWSDGNTLDVKSGELKGYLDVRDGNEGQAGQNGAATPLYKGIPYYQQKLDQFVQTFAKAFDQGIVNGTDGAGHADGYGLDGTSGRDFFTMLDSSGQPLSTADFNALSADVDTRYNNITAANFAVSYDVMTNTDAIAASDTPGQSGNIENLNSLLALRNNTQMFGEGAPEDFMKSLVSSLGIDSQQAQIFSGNESAIVNQVVNQRTSNSGVSLDEEMSNLIKYQQAYNASAKMITTMADVFDTLVNKLGV